MKARIPQADLQSTPVRPSAKEASASPLQAIAEAAPRTAQLRALGDTVSASPRMAAHGRANAAMFGAAAGLPAQLKAGVEAMSGLNLDHVRVHYNSSKPAQLAAHAFAQGHDIHLATGQEKHLPHETWHVVQQAQGRVKPGAQLAGQAVNHDAALEREADQAGARALAAGAKQGLAAAAGATPVSSGPAVVQRVALTLPNGAEAWSVDSNAEPSHIMHWIDQQAGDFNGNALATLIRQLQAAPRPSSTDHLLFLHAMVKLDAIQEGIALRQAAMAPITDAATCIRRQAAFQDWLAQHASMAQVMAHHRSAGFEFEFATYTRATEVSSHEVLAESAPLSPLFKLPFVLETDSGHELEIGFPPLLSPPEGKSKKRLKEMWQVMRAEMARIRDASPGATIDELVASIEAAGLGTGWKVKSKDAAGMRVAAERGKHKTTTAHVYTQLNLSMGPAESAKLMRQIAKKPGLATDAEKELIIPVHEQVAALLNAQRAAVNHMSDDIFTHVAKAATSMMAIPSVMVAGSPLLASLVHRVEKLFDLQSTVKELHGVWIKDSLPNILRALGPAASVAGADLLARTKDQLLEYITAALSSQVQTLMEGQGAKKLADAFAASLKGVEGALNKAYSHAQAWFGDVDFDQHAELLQALTAADLQVQAFGQGDSYRLVPEFGTLHQRILALKGRLQRYRRSANTAGEHRTSRNGRYIYLTDPDWVEPQQDLDSLQTMVTEVARVKSSSLPRRLVSTFSGAIDAELTGAIAALRSDKGNLRSPKTAFNSSEQFGQGLGVRKDTHIPTLPGGRSVAELRGDSILADYLG